MKPFILKQHKKTSVELRELELSEIGLVSGGEGTKDNPVKLPPVTVTGTRNGDGGDPKEGADFN